MERHRSEAASRPVQERAPEAGSKTVTAEMAEIALALGLIFLFFVLGDVLVGV